MILALIIFFGLMGLQGLRLLAKHIDQKNYERRRFELFVAEQLDRLDKIVAEGNNPKWIGRN